MNLKRILPKICTVGSLLCIFVVLAYISVVTTKSLYIRDTITEELPVSEQPKTEEEKLKVFEKVTTEQMIEYLQEKYGKEFVAIDYDTGQIYEKEGMKVYPKDGNDRSDIFTINKQDDGSYKDTYPLVYKRQEAIDLIKGRLETIRGLKNVPYYIHVDLTDVDEENNTFTGRATILLDAKRVSIKAVTPLSKVIKKNMKELENFTFESVTVNSTYVQDFSSINEDTFAIYNSKPYLRAGDSNDV